MDAYVDIKVQIIFSSISYTKFLKQKARSSKFITNEKGGTASDYFLYCAEDWPEKANLYNDPVDQVIFIDCGSDDFGSATANGKNETVLRKYISFAIMRLKDMCYRRSQMYGQRGQVHCMILSVFPFHKCMMAMSALLGKMLSDSDIYVSFIADVVSRPEYRYTFNWVRSYGWKFDVYYNAAFSPYKGSVRCSSSPKMKLQEIDRLTNATTSFHSAWLPGSNGMPAAPYWVDKHAKKDKDGNVTYGTKGASKQKVMFYDKTEKKTKTYDGEKVTLTEWIPQDKETEVWVPDDPNVQRWQDPDTGRCLVRYNGQIYDREYLYDYWKQAVHPTDDQLKQRIGEAHQKYEEADKRSDELFERAVAAQEAGDSQYTEQYINKEVENLKKYSGLSDEEARTMLAEQGFIPKNSQGETMYFLDGRSMTNEGLVEMVKEANDASMKALQDYLNAQKALEQKQISDILFCLNAASLVVGVVSFGATTALAAGLFAIADLTLNVVIVEFQIKGSLVEGKGVMDAFGSSTGERAFNIAVTGIAVIADVFSMVPIFKGPIPKANMSGRTQKVINAKGETEWHTTVTYKDGSNRVIKRNASGEIITNEMPKAKASSSTQKVTNARGEAEWHTTVTREDGSTQVIRRNKHGETITGERKVINNGYVEETIGPNGEVKKYTYRNGVLDSIEDTKAGTKKSILRNSNGEIEGITYSRKTGPHGEITIETVETYKDGVHTGTNGKPVKDGGRIDKNGEKVGGDGSNSKSGGTSGENAANADNADTPIEREDKAAQDVANDGDGNVSSNTGNADKLVEDIKKGMIDSIGEPLGGMKNAFNDFKGGKITGTQFAKNISIDFAKLIAGLDHWICIGIAYNNLKNSDDFSTEEIIDLDERPIDTSDEFERNNAELHEIKNHGEIGNLVGMDPKSLDAEAIANNSKEVLDSLKEYELLDEANIDYSEMNTAANNVIAAQKKVEAAQEWVKTEKEMGIVMDEVGIENAVTDSRYADLWNRNNAAAELLEDPDSDYGTINRDTIVDIAEAELEGAQVDLLLQQVIQKDRDNKMIDDE